MINVRQSRDAYILKPTVPSGTERIDYEVTIGGSLIFVGQTGYFGGVYEVDCSDWIDGYIDSAEKAGTQVYSLTVSVKFTFTGSGTTTSTLTKTWNAEGTNLPVPVQSSSCPFLYLELSNCGFVHYDATTSTFKVPLWCRDSKLIGRSTDRLEKVTYMDRYSDVHNGSVTNKYEIECYVDPDWLDVHSATGIVDYYCVMLALQNAKGAVMRSGGNYFIRIPGMVTASVTSMEGRVKDVEEIEVRSSYGVNNRVPSLKITFEVYR